MKQVFFDGKGKVHLKDVPAPQCDNGHVLVRVANSIISTGTESMALAGGGSLLRQAFRRPDLARRTLRFATEQGVRAAVGLVRSASESWFPTGYSAAGTIEEIGGGVTSFAVGDRVACAGAGHANHAEFITVPVNLSVNIPEGLPFREACFATVGSIALQGVRRAQPTLGETVVVFGTGLIGLLTAQLLDANGCRVICADVAPERLRAAHELGFDHSVNVGEVDIVKAVLTLTGGDGADAVILTASTKSSEPLNQAFQMSRECGRVVIVGAVGMDLQREDFYHKEIDLRMSRSYGPGRYDPEYEGKGLVYPLGYVRWTETRNLAAFLDKVASKGVEVAPLISAEYSIDDAIAAYQRVVSGDAATIGVVLNYPDGESRETRDRDWHLATASAISKSQVGLVLVGAGNFSRVMHIPNLKALSKCVSVRAVVSRSGGSARRASEELGASLATTDLTTALAAEDIDAVLIATRHHLHAQQCLDAARASKHIFVEKPLGLTSEECQEIMATVEQYGVLCTVGFNRRLATLTRALRATLGNVTGPKQMIYRVNAGPLPKSHWLLDPLIGGGRIVGESCHFFDLMTFLAGSDPVSVSAHSVSGYTDEEFAAIVRFADGSIGTLIYTGLGDPTFPKERIEVLVGGGVAVLDDFRSLTLSGLPGRNIKMRTQDKGHRALLTNFLDAVKGEGKLAVTAQDGFVAMLCTEAVKLSLSENRSVQLE